MKNMKMKTTLLLAFFLLFSYVALSKDYIYIPWEYLKDFGFLLSNPLTLFTYAFIHISPSHLASNMLLLLAVGFIAEQKLSPKEYFAVFFLSAIASALVFAFIAPDIILVGASAAISGILAVSFFIDFKKTLIGIAIFALALPYLTLAINTQVQAYYSSVLLENQALEQKEMVIEKQIKQAIEANNTKLLEELTAKKKKVQLRKNKTEEVSKNIEEGKEREKQSIVMQVVHVAGALAGVVFMMLFKRDIIISLPEQFDLAKIKRLFIWKKE